MSGIKDTIGGVYLGPKEGFKKAIIQILENHFEPSIVDKFDLTYEAQLYNNDSLNIWKQLKDKNFVLEVRYRNSEFDYQYICDLYSWETKPRTESHLLRFITDKVKAGKIGKDWVSKGGGKLGISSDIRSGKYETPDEKIPNIPLGTKNTK